LTAWAALASGAPTHPIPHNKRTHNRKRFIGTSLDSCEGKRPRGAQKAPKNRRWFRDFRRSSRHRAVSTETEVLKPSPKSDCCSAPQRTRNRPGEIGNLRSGERSEEF
jgi:hypothetical protein